MRTLRKRGSAGGLMKNADAVFAVSLVSKPADKRFHLLGIHSEMDEAHVAQEQGQSGADMGASVLGVMHGVDGTPQLVPHFCGSDANGNVVVVETLFPLLSFVPIGCAIAGIEPNVW